MDADVLFLMTLKDCAKAADSHNDYEILRATGMLRQLLVDGGRLVDHVNRQRKVKLNFPVQDAWASAYNREVMIDDPSMVCVLDGLIQGEGPPGARGPALTLNRDQFLKFRLIYANGKYFTVNEVIDHCANIMGGVHLGAPRTATQQQLTELQEFKIGNMTLSLRQITPILKVVIGALSPLHDQIVKERDIRIE